jgi:hypothetical protein
MGKPWRRIGKRPSLMIIFVVAGLLGACGSGATEGPDLGAEEPAADEQGSTSSGGGGEPDKQGKTSTGGGDDRGDGGEEYGWGLPEGPTSPDDTFEDDVYVLLAAGNCAKAQSSLDGVWVQLKSPRGVLLYQAAVHFCAGERHAGEERFDQASAFGWKGVDWVAHTDKGGFRFDCEVYKSIRSVLEQRARDNISCPGGDGPTWLNPEYWVPGTRDDPRTAEDESVTSEPTEPPTDEPTEPPNDEPTDDPSEPPTEPPTDG